MNKLQGQIKSIKTNDGLSIVECDIYGKYNLKAILIETPETADYLKIGTQVHCLFKATEVIMSTNSHENISLSNALPCRIVEFKKSKLLCNLVLSLEDAFINAVIETEAFENMQLMNNQEVFCHIKINEIMLSPI